MQYNGKIWNHLIIKSLVKNASAFSCSRADYLNRVFARSLSSLASSLAIYPVVLLLQVTGALTDR